MKLAVFCVVLAAVAPGAAAQGTVNVEGVVVNKVTGAGIGGATVRFIAPKSDRYETTSDETGAFRISGIKPGDYRSLAEKHGYFSSEIPTFAGGNTQRFNAGGDPIRLRLELIPPAVIHAAYLARMEIRRALQSIWAGGELPARTRKALLYSRISNPAGTRS